MLKILHLKTQLDFLFADSKWILGENGKSCNKVCGKKNRTCNSDEQSKITSEPLVRNAMKSAGEDCKDVRGHRPYAGTPYSNNGTCVYLTKGSKSVCTGFHQEYHSALCYCGKMVLFIDVLKMFSNINHL